VNEDIITTFDDSRVTPFARLVHDDKRELETFVAEGENVVLRLLESRFAVRTVLCVDAKAGRIRPHLQANTTLLIAEKKLIQQIVGYNFNAGVLAIAERAELPPLSFLTDDLQSASRSFLVLPEITNAANFGALLRTAAAFGVDRVLLGEQCRSPFNRQTVRTSMGTIFALRIARSVNLKEDLLTLRSLGVTTIATVLDADAPALPTVARPRHLALLMGEEGPGLPRYIMDLCDQRTTIPMSLGTDSLNVASAAAVFLYHFQQALKE
jgi:tRNA G18 (ribose-2'-O)-methylase SpoU